jgi:bifunctional UDP-N-acetylglucosamine pyrophosphorylase/glucosamine-1-phosphate N-acetyltransferase
MASDPALAPTRPSFALLLAAGLGTRMRSPLAKVLHPALGRPLVTWAVDAARAAALLPVVVVNHQEDAVRAALADRGCRFARQEAPRGTGDAVASGLQAIDEDGVVVVLCGDGPLIRAETLRGLCAAHAAGGRPVTVLTMRLAAPGAYGRIVRDGEGRVLRIVEAGEASPQELAITEVNTGIYALDIAWLRATLPGLRPHPPKGELYLTDVVERAAAEGGAHGLLLDDAREAMGVNDRAQLAEAEGILQERVLRAWMEAGVGVEAPASVTVEAEVELGPDAAIERGAVLRGRTRVGAGARVGAYSVLVDAELEPGAQVLPHCALESCTVASGASVGPFARLRPEARVEEGAKVGNFVEIKKARIAPGAKVPHLSYVGDATVGAGANIGAGTITCNYDGVFKHHTEIGPGAFIGSNSALVAPVRVGAGALVGAGSVITKDVPDDAVALTRAKQEHWPDAARRLRERKLAEKARRGGATPSKH